MKKLAVLLVMVMAVSAVAQQSKPSAAIGATHTTPALSAPARVANDAFSLPVGTAIRMKLETPLSSATAKRGDHFGGRLVQAVLNGNGKVMIPVGTAIEGEVVQAAEQRNISGGSTIDLLPHMLTLPDGSRFRISASVVDTSNHDQVDVNDEGAIKARSHDRGDLIETGVGAAAGMTIGGLARGGKGLLIGGAIGAGATIVHWLTKTKTAELPAGTEIIMELSRPFTMSAMTEGD